jgi:hypothetical protein
MAKLTKTLVLTASKPSKETVLEKTSRAVKAITEEERQEREVKTARLRKDRLEKEEDALL